MVILDNIFVTVTHHKDENYVLFEYKKFTPSLPFREAWSKVAEFVIEKQINKYVSDSRKMSVIGTDDQKWFAENWWPEVRMALSKDAHAAIVLDKGIFAQVSTQAVLSDIDKAKLEGVILNSEFFQNIDAAHDWIINVEHQLEPLAR
jgi:hypothetical protein